MLLRGPMRAGVLPKLLICTALISSASVAQEQASLLPLPQLNQCRAASHPRLPEKWHAAYLMAPFANAQLVLSDIVYDASFPAMRVKLYGMRHGSLDLFVYGNNTYSLTSSASTVTECKEIGDTGWRPLPQDWLASQSQCEGSAPIGETDVDWWKTPIEPAPSSYWIWFKTSDQTPFRLVFQWPNDRFAALSQYALSYQVSFERVSTTDLAAILNACTRSKRTTTKSAARALRKRIDAMSNSRERADREIEQVMPQLASCAIAPLPKWPSRLAITGLMTPFDFHERPYATEVLYDWSVPAQRSRIFFSPESPSTAQDALLLGPRGYNVTYQHEHGPICAPGLPGTIRPDWAARAPCSCEAVINGTTSLTPYGTTQILACPLASPRAAWAWYTLTGRPTAFMVTSLRGDQGFGLFAILDYRDWLPGHRFPRSVFDKPAQCDSDTPLPPPRSRTHEAAGPKTSNHCSTCHVGSSASAQ